MIDDTITSGTSTGRKPSLLSEVELYEIIKSHIQHENTLIHNRVTWLLTLQGFLFGGYGFTLSAQATLYVQGITRVPWFIYNARTSIAVMGLLSSIVLLFGSAAAAISIIKFIDIWKQNRSPDSHLPQVAGEAVPGLGAYAGLMPTYAIPVATSIVWVTLVHNVVTWPIFIFIVIAMTYGMMFMIPDLVHYPPFSFLYAAAAQIRSRILSARVLNSGPNESSDTENT